MDEIATKYLQRKQFNESTSAFGQYIYDTYPHSFFFMDVDGIILKNFGMVLRVLEQKDCHASLKRSQKCILPILAVGIDQLVASGKLHAQSGVFAVYIDPPFDGPMTIQRIKPGMRYEVTDRIELSDEDKARFLSGDFVLALGPDEKTAAPLRGAAV
jgi:hypothetical protein